MYTLNVSPKKYVPMLHSLMAKLTLVHFFPTLCCAFVTRILIDCSNRFLHPVKSLLYNAAKGEQEGMWIVTHG